MLKMLFSAEKRSDFSLKTKKIPMRMCVVCHTSKPKKELVRIVRGTDGVISLDLTGRLNGRGAYVCPNSLCLEKAIKTKRLSRVFEMPIENELYEKLRAEIEAYSRD